MTPHVTKPKRLLTMRRAAAGLLVVAGFALAGAAPALADGKHKHWDNGNHYGHYKHKHHDQVRYYDDGPDVIYVEKPVYVRERVYVRPAPVYYEPAPVVIRQRPSINIVVPLFD